MPSKIYVGNMSYSTTEDELRDLFAPYGEVVSVSVVYDRATGRPRGFAFVEMGTTEAAEGAISALNGQEVGGRQLRVNAAKPAGSEGRGGGGGGRGGYGWWRRRLWRRRRWWWWLRRRRRRARRLRRRWT